MMGRLLTLLLMAASMGLSACAQKTQEDCGFVQNVYGERISWKGELPVKLQVHESVPSQYYGAIQAAADRWNQAAGRQVVALRSSMVPGAIAPKKDGTNVIYYMNTWESDRRSEQARTSIYWVGDQIKEADIRVNASQFQFYWNQGGYGVNFEALLLHEIGHVLGLKHKDNDGSVMATYLANNTDRVYVSQTDLMSLQCEY